MKHLIRGGGDLRLDRTEEGGALKRQTKGQKNQGTVAVCTALHQHGRHVNSSTHNLKKKSL